MVLKDYDPSKGGRGMKLQRDQSIEILDQDEMDWWYGRTSSGQVGWIPKEIVENSEPQQVSVLVIGHLNHQVTSL